VWVQAARLGLRIKEVGVPRIYVDPNRSFGLLNDATERLAYYRRVIQEALAVCPAPAPRAAHCFDPLTCRSCR
jgi:hypothetical protein